LHCARTSKSTTTWVCQKYIERPLLLGGRKHDIRQWVLVTCVNPLVIWFYGECYVRIAAEEYGLDDIRANLRHLTNNAIASQHPQFDADDDHWKCMWEESEYRKFLQCTFGFDAYTSKVLPAMKQAVIETLKSTQEALADSQGAACCFELLGYDFMVDTDLGVWLLEVNTSPSMEYSTNVTGRMCPAVLEDSLRVVLQGDGPEEAPHGAFELLHTGPSLPEDRSPNVAAAAGLLTLEGKRIRRPEPELLPNVLGLDGGADLLARLAERREQEIGLLVEKQRLQRAKEQEKRDRSRRLKESLKLKVLRSASAASLPQLLAAPCAGDQG